MSTNVSSVVSHFPTAQNGFTTTTAGSVASGATTVTLNSVAGYTNGEPVVLVIEPTSTSAKQTFTGIIDTAGVQVTSVVWTAGTNQTHALGSTVVDYATATHIAMISKGIKVEHAQAGTHTNITQADANYIKDDAGNELLKWSKTASAVNEVTIKNAATGNAPIIRASGGDSAVNLNLQGKGLAKTVTIGAGAATIFPYDYVVSGCVITADAAGSTRLATMTSGVVVINGNPVTVAASTSRTYTASKDVYVDVLDNGDGTGLLVFTDNTTNAVSPALASNSVRLGIVVVGASSIATAASINQGQEDRVLPIASSVPYAVTDSLGNLICPRDPNRKLLGLKWRTSILSGVTTQAQIPELSCPVIIPTGRKVKVSTGCARAYASTTAGELKMIIWDGAVGGTGVGLGQVTQSATSQPNNIYGEAITTPSTSSKTYNISASASAGTGNFDATAGYPMFIKVELE